MKSGSFFSDLESLVAQLAQIKQDMVGGVVRLSDYLKGIAGRIFGPSPEIQDHINRNSQRHGLDPVILTEIIRAESGFNPNAVSPVGAVGLMQLMPDTAKWLGVDDPFDVAQNIDGGARYFKSLLLKYDYSLKLALAAYNAGPGVVDKYKTIPPYPETQQYVDRIIKSVEMKKKGK